MKLSETAFVKTLSQLGSVHKRNLVLLLIIPVIFYFVYPEVLNSAVNYSNNQAAPRGVNSVRSKIDGNGATYDMLKNAVVDYEAKYILAGIVKEYLVKYFTPPPPPPPPVVRVAPRAVRSLGTTAAVKKPDLPRKVSEYKFALSMIAWTKGHAYVVIDDKILREGERTSAGLLVNRIEKNRVLLSNKWSSEWVTLNF
jgi:hypothetical protein